MHRVTQDDVELEKSVRRLREKFYGKVTIRDAVILMRMFNNDHDLACQRIIERKNEMGDIDLEDDPDLANDLIALELIERLQEEEEQRQQAANNNPDEEDTIQVIAQQLQVLPLSTRNLRMFNNAQNNLIPPSDCQFACGPCDKVWWRRVPQRKQVSHCHRCGIRYDPVPADKMWGVAEFQCANCDRTFRYFAQMGILVPCYTCRTPIYPSLIIPPRNLQVRRSRQPHSCFAEDCHNCREPRVQGVHCIHPQSRARRGLPRVIYPSQEHESTGSTVATCISQGSLAEFDIDQLILEDLQEQAEEEGDEDGGSSN